MFCTPPPHRFGERFLAMLRNPWLAWPAEPDSLAGRFNVTLAYLCRLLGEHLDRRRDAALAARVMPAYRYLDRLTRRFIALAMRAQAGTLRPPPPRPPRSSPNPPPNPPLEPAAEAPPPRPPGLPRGRGWLRRLVPTLAPAAGDLHALLQHPEMLALVAMGPQTGRLLRPLCRALALPLPDYLRLPPRPRRPRPPDPARQAARAAARTAARAETAWARAFRRSLGLPARPPRDVPADPRPQARPPPKRA